MTIRAVAFASLLAGALLLAGCEGPDSGPIGVSAIGGEPRLVNPNLQPLDSASAFLVEAVAQGLVRFDSAGEIEPALAQSWIVSDDGLRYTFRIRRIDWPDGSRVTAQQVVARLRAALSQASRNPLKPVLTAVEDVVAMTDNVLEISLRGPRPNFLQLLAQPEMAIILNDQGTGPYRLIGNEATGARLSLTPSEEDEDELLRPDILLRGGGAALAVARFAEEETDLVIGGTAGDLPIARAAGLPAATIAFDPVSGLFGLVFEQGDGPTADPALRRAMSMAVDRQALAAALNVPGLGVRTRLLVPGSDLPAPAQPDWAASPLPMRRELAARAVAALDDDTPRRVRVAMPEGPGYRLLFAHLRRDWRLIGIEAVRVEPDAAAELRWLDEVAPAALASWYLRHFTCDSGRVCDPVADEAMAAARLALDPAERQAQLARADQILTGITPFIPIASPVRWSLASPRLTGFRPNPFARHPAVELIADRP